MTLKLARFTFETTSVTFIGSRICVYEHLGDNPGVLAEYHNEWTSKGKENDGVMGRQHKPRVTDAQALVARARKEKSKRPKGS
ncbi:MAG: hypothetical protein KDB00_10915 [Planctomycetales bacterium]|nr:hypothetical protein [Planctomycetales bacterium]